MFFCSLDYLYFFCAVFAAYWLMPWAQARVWLLLGASFFFYACFNKWLALVVGASTVLDYLLARGIDGSSRPRVRRLLLTASIVANMGLLCYFKYVNFFLESFRDALHSAGFSASIPLLEVILPIGISFYTFEAISYMVDVYRRRIPAEKNLSHFMLFITFFPHLVAGPIVRSRDFLPQIARPKRWSWSRLHLGAGLFLLGFIKKVIADRMAQFADPVFAEPGNFSRELAWIGVLAYAVQIFCDFSGYTDMALGSAHMLGYKLAQNFNMPYLASNIADFWRRWHMSLSSWLRDYLFIPLGGSRGSGWLTARNLMITMALGGLWHGASWTFVVWGALHGLFLIVHRLFRETAGKQAWVARALSSLPGQAMCIALTFLTVSLTWIFFRATSFENATAVLQRLVGGREPGTLLPVSVSLFYVLAGITLAAHVLASSGLWRRLAPRLPTPVLGFGYAAALSLTLLLYPDANEILFIYFQF